MELDHVFVMCEVGAPEADALTALGLREGSPNTHPGQGTACRRFFFENAYLELVWVADAAEAQAPAVVRTRLWERWSRRRIDASPFGIVLRGGANPDTAHATWPTWSYRPSWLAEGQAIEFAQQTPLAEPEIIVLPFARERARSGQEPLNHGLPLTRIASVSCGVPGLLSGPSDAACALQRAGIVTFERSNEPLVRLTFAGGRGASIDLRPTLPLVIAW